LASGFVEAFAAEREPMGIVDKAIEDGICGGGIVDDSVPVLDWKLARHDD